MKHPGTEEAAELSTLTEAELVPVEGIDLRQEYITPFYLETMQGRVRDWAEEQIRKQLILFKRTLPGYPEVLELLEGELHRRNLNRLYRHARGCSPEDLRALIKKYGSEPDFREVLETELELRSGATHLADASGET